MEVKVYLSLGSNLGSSEKNLYLALQALLQHPQIFSLQLSAFYNSTPVGPVKQQANFVNTCCSFYTSLSPWDLLQLTQDIEKKRGKNITTPKGPRTLDIDILFYGTLFLEDPRLHLPHPSWKQRLFVLKPLLSLTPTLSYQRKNKIFSFSIKDLIENFQNVDNEKLSLLSSPFYRKITKEIDEKQCAHAWY